VAEEFETPVEPPPVEREPEPAEPPTQTESVPSPLAAKSAPGPDDYESTFTQRTPLVIERPAPEPEPEPAPVAAPSRRPAVLICVDADLAILELLKRGLHSDTTRIHIFQSATDALQRFKQYVVRGETPALIVGSMIEDPLDAHQGLGWRRFAGRILGIAPRLRLVVVARSGESVAAPGMAVVKRPDPKLASELDYQAFVVEVDRALAASA
jgi:hypothetical protein